MDWIFLNLSFIFHVCLQMIKCDKFFWGDSLCYMISYILLFLIICQICGFQVDISKFKCTDWKKSNSNMKKAKIQIDIGEMSSKILVFFIKGCDPGVSDSSAHIHICQDTVRIAAIYIKSIEIQFSAMSLQQRPRWDISPRRETTLLSPFINFLKCLWQM